MPLPGQSTADEIVSQTPIEEIRDQTYLQTKLLRSISNSINNIELFLVKSSSSIDDSQNLTRDLILKLDNTLRSVVDVAQQYRDTNNMKSRKYFVVVKGHNPGVYENFDLAASQIEGMAGAYVRAFDKLEEATLFHQHITQCADCKVFDPQIASKLPKHEEETKTEI